MLFKRIVNVWNGAGPSTQHLTCGAVRSVIGILPRWRQELDPTARINPVDQARTALS